MSGLEGKVAVITGATSGIGLATAEALSERGVKLVLHGRRGEILQAHAARLPNCDVLAGDIADPATPDALVDLAMKRFGRMDIAFANAGLIASGPVDDVDLDAMSDMLRVNIDATFRFAYTALRHMKKAGGGDMLFTGSVLGTKTRPNAGPYAATKYAVEALAESLRMELAGTGVRVAVVEPGLVRTDLHRDYEVRPEIAQSVPQPLTPADVARAVVFAVEQPASVLIPRIMVLPSGQNV
ncbi:SDR family oxidoreductase [Thalassobaculum salexigens]|uniref:SDR family oxidoreductase n=1 Tax=Thalassobaculum salexigens TaxID=455360 RepID=UPI00248D99D3|nr:SDR family oxidoreductase [Thalassobaculum salexigens]